MIKPGYLDVLKLSKVREQVFSFLVRKLLSFTLYCCYRIFLSRHPRSTRFTSTNKKDRKIIRQFKSTIYTITLVLSICLHLYNCEGSVAWIKNILKTKHIFKKSSCNVGNCCRYTLIHFSFSLCFYVEYQELPTSSEVLGKIFWGIICFLLREIIDKKNKLDFVL